MRPAISQEVVNVLDRFPTHTTLPASDLERAKAWYRDKLELVPKEEDAGGVYYESGGRSFALFQTPYAGTAQNTAMEWSVDDVEKVVAHLKDRGVTFDTYDIPGVEWNGEIAIMGPFKGAWFKDSEGNILSLTQPAES